MCWNRQYLCIYICIWVLWKQLLSDGYEGTCLETERLKITWATDWKQGGIVVYRPVVDTLASVALCDRGQLFLTWLPAPVPGLNDGMMYGCWCVLLLFFLFVIRFILFCSSKTVCAIFWKENTFTQLSHTCTPAQHRKTLHDKGKANNIVPGWADSSPLNVISSSFTISFHISLSPSGEKARCRGKEIMCQI